MQDFFDADSAAVNPPDTGLSETLRDFEYFSMLCPGKLRRIQSEAEAVCDRLDYRGSPIYDEYPDRTAMEQLSCGIVRRVSEHLPESGESVLDAAELRFYRGSVITGNPEPPSSTMKTALPEEKLQEEGEQEGEIVHTEDLHDTGHSGNPENPDWEDIAALLLFSEIQYRRCRNRGTCPSSESRL